MNSMEPEKIKKAAEAALRMDIYEKLRLDLSANKPLLEDLVLMPIEELVATYKIFKEHYNKLSDGSNQLD